MSKNLRNDELIKVIDYSVGYGNIGYDGNLGFDSGRVTVNDLLKDCQLISLHAPATLEIIFKADIVLYGTMNYGSRYNIYPNIMFCGKNLLGHVYSPEDVTRPLFVPAGTYKLVIDMTSNSKRYQHTIIAYRKANEND
jgi:hypothetical protein